jgi:hypothetical protein
MKTDASGNINCTPASSTISVQHDSSFSFTGNLSVDSIHAGTVGLGMFPQFYPPSTITSCLSLSNGDQNRFEHEMILSPNPSSEKISISSPFILEATNIYNSLGSLMITSKNETDITISSLPAGIYFLRVQTVDSVFAKKFIKE